MTQRLERRGKCVLTAKPSQVSWQSRLFMPFRGTRNRHWKGAKAHNGKMEP